MIKKILVALDGSDYASKALDFAIDIAAKHDADMHLINVVELTDLPDSLRRFAEAEHISGSSTQIYDVIAQGVLEDGAARAKESGVKTVKPVILHGDAVEQIVEYAKGTSIDMIAVGSRGLSDFKSLLLGGVSHKLSTLAPCTCMIVR